MMSLASSSAVVTSSADATWTSGSSICGCGAAMTDSPGLDGTISRVMKASLGGSEIARSLAAALSASPRRLFPLAFSARGGTFGDVLGVGVLDALVVDTHQDLHEGLRHRVDLLERERALGELAVRDHRADDPADHRPDVGLVGRLQRPGGGLDLVRQHDDPRLARCSGLGPG